MKRIAIIKNGTVENVAMWDGKSAWKPAGTLVDVTDKPHVAIGWTYDGSDFAAPVESAE
jgi:hypothetical protein